MEGLNEIRTAISSENILLLQSYNVTFRKKLEEVSFVKGDFLYKKISNKDVYKEYGAMADILEDAGHYWTFISPFFIDDSSWRNAA